MIVLIIVAVVLLVLLLGGLLAWLFTRVDTVVTDTKEEIVMEQRAYNPGITMGHEIKVDADYATQLKEARLEAARKAAALPRGGNFGIGRLGDPQIATASKGLADDPMTAVRIAHFHGWDGARSGVPAGGVPVAAAAAPAAVAAATATAAEIELVPGRDYPEIAITDDMSPEEIRKARTANAKARSAAMKAAKAAQGAAAPVAAAPAAAVAGVAAAASAPVGVGIEPPKLIDITDDMPPEEVRKARVANAKAQSAYNKALKAAGGTPGMATAAVAETAAPVAAAAPTPVTPVGIEPPQLIVITDDMAPEDVRKARVANAKAQSAYNKALKAAGIDPSAVSAEAGAGGVPVAAAPEATPTPAPAAAAAAAAPAAGGVTPEALGIPRPQLIEITDSMSPDDVRQARIANAKAQSAFNKALKAAGIDPATVQ
jgi:hypothetical protein